MMLRILDWASYQGTPDVTQVAASNIAGVVLKATQGGVYVNPTFKANWPAIRAVGLWRAAYHYATPDDGEPEDEADHFLETVGALDTGDALVLDLESGAGDLAEWALRWLTYVEARVGFRPIFYSGAYFMVPHGLTGRDDLARFPLWLASYVTGPPNLWPEPPPNWRAVSLWQFTDAATVPGVEGKVDMSLFDGTPEALAALGKPAPADPAPDRAPLDALFSAIQGAQAAFTAPPDQDDLTEMIRRMQAVKARNGIP